ncbi:MAG: alpha/beta fold hydrolase [Pirellulales bacterium]
MKRVDVADTTLAVRDQGHGSPVLFVHGFPLDGGMWNAQLAALSAEHRVIVPDLRGFGGSPLQGAADDTVTTMAQLADDLAELLAVLRIEEPLCLCGLSMGGYVAWEFWRRHRDRLSSLVLCDTRAAADAPEAVETRRTTATRLLRDGVGFLAQAMLPKLLAPQTLRDEPGLVAELTAMIESNEPLGLAAALRGMAERADATPWLGDVDLPTLVVVGEHDQISTVDEMRAIAASLPNARFVAVPGAGHMAPMENAPLVCDELLAFLGEQG